MGTMKRTFVKEGLSGLRYRTARCRRQLSVTVGGGVPKEQPNPLGTLRVATSSFKGQLCGWTPTG